MVSGGVVRRPFPPALLVGLALVGCGGADLPFEPAGPEAAPDPSTSGPYPVGVRTLRLVDPEREDRPIVVEVWYPAVEEARGGPGVTYGTEDFLDARARAATASIAIELSLPTTAVRDAAPRTEDGPFPVVLFSHGSYAVRVQSTFLTVDLASHGYVVVAPDHHGNLLSDLLSGEAPAGVGFAGFIVLRPDDVRFTQSYFRFTPPDWAVGLMDFDRVGAAGHSFGAMTALRLSGLADRSHPLHAVVAQAPPRHGLTWAGIERPLSEVGMPVMIQGGAKDGTTKLEEAESFWDRGVKPKQELILEDGGHFTFSDLCLLDRAVLERVAESGIGDVLSDGCGEDFVPARDAFPVMRHFTIGWFNAWLRGSTATLDRLDAAASQGLAPSVRVRSRREL